MMKNEQSKTGTERYGMYVNSRAIYCYRALLHALNRWLGAA